MYDIHSRPGVKNSTGFFVLIGAIGAGMLIGGLVSMIYWSASTGLDFKSMQFEMKNPKFVQQIRMLQFISTLFIFFVPALVMAYVLNKKPFRFIGFNFYFSKKQLGMVVLIMLASVPIVGALSELNEMIPIPKNLSETFKRLEAEYIEQVKIISKISGFGDYIISLLIMALAPAIFEETFFRGGVQNLMERTSKSPWVAVIVTSIIFSAIHFSYYGFLPRLALGVLLGLFYQYTGSLWMSIWAHFFNNAMVVTNIYYNTLKGIPVDEAMNDGMPIWTGLIGLVLVIFLFRKFKTNAIADREKLVPKEQIALEDQWLSSLN